MNTLKPFLRLAAAALLLILCVTPAAAQLGPYTLLSGGTNGTPTNGVFYPALGTVRIPMGNYSEVGLYAEARTIAAATTNGWAIGWVRSVNGTRWESNVWTVTYHPLNSAATNGFTTNLTVGPMWGIAPLWISNRNVNAYGTNCLTNVLILYLGK